MTEAAIFSVREAVENEWDFNVLENSHFKSDVWDLRSLLNNKRTNVQSTGKLNFGLLASKPLIIEPIKRYCFIRLGQVKPLSVTNEYSILASKLIAFMYERKINSLEQITSELFLAFNIWLKQHYFKKKSTANNMVRIANTLLQIITMGQSLGFPGVPKKQIFLEVSLWDWWGANSISKQIRADGPENRSIPTPIWQQIIQKAWTEPNIIQTIKSGKSVGLIRVNNAKFGILIQAYTGLRISEVLYLKSGCVEKDKNEKCWLTVEIEKTEQEPTPHRILIPKSIYTLILELEQLTQALRFEAEENNYLFYTLSRRNKKPSSEGISHRYKPVALESGKWNTSLLRPFLERNSVPLTFKNKENKTIALSSHSFRHTFARIAVAEQGVNPSVIQSHFKHLSIEMTMHYVSLTKLDLKKSYLQGMMDTDNIYTQGAEGELFKQHANDVKTLSNLDDAVDKLSKIFGINPLPFGLCLYDFKRGHCPNLGAQSCYMIGCGDFVTNKSFLPNFYNEMKLIDLQIDRCHNHGQIVEEKQARFHQHKLQNMIENIKKD